mmetsp:Transcript_3482/g.8685  ORF Transcript_3482/g.8685 Transcript_3482/m.8685 type:complete len:243 (+) Transcript_3482:56-784(+)
MEVPWVVQHIGQPQHHDTRLLVVPGGSTGQTKGHRHADDDRGSCAWVHAYQALTRNAARPKAQRLANDMPQRVFRDARDLHEAGGGFPPPPAHLRRLLERILPQQPHRPADSPVQPVLSPRQPHGHQPLHRRLTQHPRLHLRVGLRRRVCEQGRLGRTREDATQTQGRPEEETDKEAEGGGQRQQGWQRQQRAVVKCHREGRGALAAACGWGGPWEDQKGVARDAVGDGEGRQETQARGERG